MSRAYTKQEVREMFLDHIKTMVDYWPRFESDSRKACGGLAFSILTLIDGSTNLPAIKLVLEPHPEDKAYCIDEGMDYFEPDMCFNDDVMLHEFFCQKK